MTKSECLELWYAALRSKVGILVQHSDWDAFRTKMYQARKEAGDPALDVLMIVNSPTSPGVEAWIAHRTIEVEDGQG